MNETVIAFAALVLSVPSAIVTFIYSHQQTKAAARANALTERAQREQSEPYVIADIRERVPGSQLLAFVIENTGPTMARDVELTINPPLQTTLGDETAAKLNEAVTRKIPVLPPRRQLMFLMDVGNKLFNSDLPRLYTVIIKSAGPFGPVEPLTYTIDLDVLKNTLLNRESLEWSTHIMAEEAQKARKAQEKQASAMLQLSRDVAHEIEARRPNPDASSAIGPASN
ncbi:hypothetical protein [Streptomyces sp. NPDC093269]|uniref:hypothetical protein n=1 Tax=Streptomyces sp. NPDC093269 TaxID=3366038 RepID=UPI003828A67E